MRNPFGERYAQPLRGALCATPSGSAMRNPFGERYAQPLWGSTRASTIEGVGLRFPPPLRGVREAQPLSPTGKGFVRSTSAQGIDGGILRRYWV
jgi:hypothetical protein